MNKANKLELVLENLHCADCANKIEKDVRKLPGVSCAYLDFVTQKLTIEAINSVDLPAITQQAYAAAIAIEPNLKISETGRQTAHNNAFDKKRKTKLFLFGLGIAVLILALIANLSFPFELGLFLTSYILVGYPVLLIAFKNIKRGKIFDENFLMGAATVGAFAIREFPEAVAVMIFYQIGEFFQDMAVNRSRKSITALMDIRPDFANLLSGEDVQKVSPEQVGRGDTILIKPGEKVPLDGIVLQGKSTLDTSALTGESYPRTVSAGSDILSGSINQSGVLTVKVTREFGESTVSKILDLVQNAAGKKAPIENFITKFARYYTPVVVFLALALAVIPPLVIPGATFSEWINRALIFLVVSCPCALVLSIPLSFFGGIGNASRRGILVKGSSYLEGLNNVDTVIFDKTGTLTEGEFKVTKVHSEGSLSNEELLEYAAHAEIFSLHPIALSIQKAYTGEINKSAVSGYQELSGRGIQANIHGKTILAGNAALMTEKGVSFPQAQSSETVVYIAADGQYAGWIEIADQIKKDSKQAIDDLRQLGIKRLVMLTGDSTQSGQKTANALGLDEVYTQLLPHQKVEIVENLEKTKSTKGKLVFVGDGMNDAPVLARADIGVAMGALGSDAAIEAADVVLMTDEPGKLVLALDIARATRNNVWQNIVFALGVKGVLLLLGAMGIANMWEAVFGDVGVALIAILNAMRLLKNIKR